MIWFCFISSFCVLIEIAENDTIQLNCSTFQHKLVVEQEMLYYASVVMGQSLMKNMQGKNEIRRDALVCFVNACR